MSWLLDKIAIWGFNRLNKANIICCEYCDTCGFASFQKRNQHSKRKRFMRN